MSTSPPSAGFFVPPARRGARNRPAVASPVNLLSRSFLSDPYPTYRMLRERAPIRWDDPTGHWWVTRHEDVHDVLRDPAFRAARVAGHFDGIPPREVDGLGPLVRLLEPRLLFTDGERHRRLRSLVGRAFAPRRIDALRPVIRREVEALLRPLRSRSRVEVIGEIAGPLPSRVITGLLGLPAESRETLKAWTEDIYAFIGVSGRHRLQRAVAANAAAESVTQLLDGAIEGRRACPTEDLLGVLVGAEESGSTLSRAEIVANVVGLLNAGHETTTNLVGNGLYTLLRHPSQLRRLQDDPTLLPGAIEEMLRFESPVQIIARQSSRGATVRGVELPDSAKVLLFLGAANRDERVFEAADTFDIGRSGPRHLAFGAGPHFCVGATLARVICEELLVRLLREWRSIRLAGRIRWRPYPIFRGLVDLDVEVAWSTGPPAVAAPPNRSSGSPP